MFQKLKGKNMSKVMSLEQPVLSLKAHQELEPMATRLWGSDLNPSSCSSSLYVTTFTYGHEVLITSSKTEILVTGFWKLAWPFVDRLSLK